MSATAIAITDMATAAPMPAFAPVDRDVPEVWFWVSDTDVGDEIAVLLTILSALLLEMVCTALTASKATMTGVAYSWRAYGVVVTVPSM
jgi:hypothetical protein